ncbi:MAG: hypothetical protein ABIJ37_05730 [Pseudomonadota bacterium]
MKEIYKNMMEESKRIASSSNCPCFYIENEDFLLMSKDIYSNNADVLKCRDIVFKQLEDNLGHGIKHAEKVTIDIGAIAFIEGERQSLGSDQIEKAIVIAQLAGLLHDIKRKEPHHAKAGAIEARIKLRNFSLNEEEKEIIVQAISNHEAFVEPKRVSTPLGQLISDSLYDADKFRWGVDNFTETFWYMADSRETPFNLIVEHFPRGLKEIRKIKDTFRTDTGKKYGPEFIELGLKTGEKIYSYILSCFSSL